MLKWVKKRAPTRSWSNRFFVKQPWSCRTGRFQGLKKPTRVDWFSSVHIYFHSSQLSSHTKSRPYLILMFEMLQKRKFFLHHQKIFLFFSTLNLIGLKNLSCKHDGKLVKFEAKKFGGVKTLLLSKVHCKEHRGRIGFFFFEVGVRSKLCSKAQISE